MTLQNNPQELALYIASGQNRRKSMVCRNVFWQYMATHSFRLFFWRFCPLGCLYVRKPWYRRRYAKTFQRF